MAFFEITHCDKNSHARAGIIHTDHGDIETPVFMPVGTQATIKSLDNHDLDNLEADIILNNTYHLHLRPGEDIIAELGGLHGFMNWDKPILTDSGGFQVFSLGEQKLSDAKRYGLRTGTSEKDQKTKKLEDIPTENARLVTIDEDGVTFRSHLDGSTHRFTPENAIEIQRKLGADIIMAFDECTPDDVNEKYAREAMERTHRWAERCIVAHKDQKITRSKDHNQFLFGIIQGGNHEALRKKSAQFISSLNFDGIAIGGESVGYNMEATKDILEWVMPFIPENKPHYTMGVGYSPMDLFEVVERGVDMFDCVTPTRVARNGRLYVHKNISKNYHINIINAQFKTDQNSIDPACDCYTCAHHTRAYVHHLFKAEELLASRLATIHNLHFFLKLMREMREAIQKDKFFELKKEWI